MKIVGAIFEKIKFFLFIFSCELPLILGVGGKLKKGSRYLREDPRYRIWTRSVYWFRLYDRRRTDRQTDTHTRTFFLKHIFRLWEWCRIKNHKKSKSSFLTIAILPSLLMSLESKKSFFIEQPWHVLKTRYTYSTYEPDVTYIFTYQKKVCNVRHKMFSLQKVLLACFCQN